MALTGLLFVTAASCSTNGAATASEVSVSAPETTSAPLPTVGSSVAPDEIDDERAMPGTVAVIGDSIALSAQGYVTAALESLGVEVVGYDAVESRRMVSTSTGAPSGLTAITDMLAGGVEPDLWIVALGTNDVGAVAVDEWQGDIDRILHTIPTDGALVWVDCWAQVYDAHAADFNRLVRGELRGRDDATVIDWHAKASTDGLIVADGVHLSDAGKVEFARLIGETLREMYG